MNMSSDDLGPESQGLPAFLLHLAKNSSKLPDNIRTQKITTFWLFLNIFVRKVSQNNKKERGDASVQHGSASAAIVYGVTRREYLGTKLRFLCYIINKVDFQK